MFKIQQSSVYFDPTAAKPQRSNRGIASSEATRSKIELGLEGSTPHKFKIMCKIFALRKFQKRWRMHRVREYQSRTFQIDEAENRRVGTFSAERDAADEPAAAFLDSSQTETLFAVGWGYIDKNINKENGLGKIEAIQ